MATAFFDSDPLKPKRTINLQGASSSLGGTQSALERAKQERVRRDLERRKEASAVVIQAAYRSHRIRRQVRYRLRQEYDALLPLDVSKAGRLPQATRLLVQLFIDADGGDTRRLATWARAAVEKLPGEGKRSLWSAPLVAVGEGRASWLTLLRSMAILLLRQAALHPNAPQTPLYLEVLKQLLDPTKGASDSVAPSLVSRGQLFPLLRRFILSFSEDARPIPATLTSAITIVLAALRAVAATPAWTAALQGAASDVLTIPLLSSRLPSSAVHSLRTGLPWVELLNVDLDPNLLSANATHLLANLVALLEPRVATFEKAPMLVSYLRALQACLDVLPSGSLYVRSASRSKGKGKATVADDAAADEDAMQVDTPVNAVTDRDPRETAQLAKLYSAAHLSALAASSTRFAASPASRPAFCAFLVSLLYSLPRTGGAREDVISLLVYGSGGGLLREVWRGWIRSGKLGRTLGASKEAYKSVATALNDAALATEWPMLVLMVELYARTLLTLGDDEFFATGPSTAQSRNPLSLDEVIGFSALLRNIAFGIYWHESSVDIEHATVAGTRMTWEELRTLTTRALQLIYARDSRKQFTPEDHWLMTGAFDLQSFVQTAIVEFSNMTQADEPIQPPARANAYDSDEDYAYAEPPRRHAPPRSAAASRREMAFISPRLGVLNNIPFVIPFETRVQVFRQFVQLDRQANGVSDMPRARGRQRAVIRRDHIADDGFAHLNSLGPMLKHRLEIAFVDQYGIEEAGIDGGGLFKEFLTSLSKEAFDTDRGLWLATQAQELYPAPHSYAREPRQISWYAFLGRIVGKALYEGILVDVPFAAFFLNKWLGGTNFLDDLQSLDPELYNGLVFLKNYNGDVEKDLTLTFSISDEEFGVSRTVDLIPNGREISVTKENRYRYIALVSHYRLNAQIKNQSAAFVSGLQEVIDPRWLRCFNQSELRLLVGGSETPIDLDDLRANTVYGRTLDEASDTVRYFWEVVPSFNQKQRRQLLRFVTSCERAPLLGFKELYPRFAIADGGEDTERLPTSSTCMNLLKMPRYTSAAALKQKLLLAISSGAGFDLS